VARVHSCIVSLRRAGLSLHRILAISRQTMDAVAAAALELTDIERVVFRQIAAGLPCRVTAA